MIRLIYVAHLLLAKELPSCCPSFCWTTVMFGNEATLESDIDGKCS